MTPRTRIKICGLTREADVAAAAECGVDAVGFVLWERSPRALTIDDAARLAERLPPFVTPVCLFVNATTEVIAQAFAAVPAMLPQLHGDETPSQCESLGRRYLRAARMRPGLALLDFAAAHPRAVGILLDTHSAGYGGSGKVFDWSLVPAGVPCPVVLSGGLNPANVIDGIVQVQPWAVDVSSGVETAPGVKDAALMRRFCEAVREADARVADAADH